MAFEASGTLHEGERCGLGSTTIRGRDPVCGYTGIIDEVCPRCGRRDGEGVSLEKLHKLGLYRNLNADTIGYHGDRFEEADRRPNPLGCCNG